MQYDYMSTWQLNVEVVKGKYGFYFMLYLCDGMLMILYSRIMCQPLYQGLAFTPMKY